MDTVTFIKADKPLMYISVTSTFDEVTDILHCEHKPVPYHDGKVLSG